MTVIRPDNPDPDADTRIKPSLADFLRSRYWEKGQAATSMFDKRGELPRGSFLIFPDRSVEYEPDPEAVTTLVDVDAKLRIVEECAARMDSGADADGSLMTSGAHLGEDVLKLLALPFADHPDYREKWRP